MWERSYCYSSFRKKTERRMRCFCGTIGLSPSIFKAIPTTFFLVLHFVFVFPPFSTSWKKGINDERRGFSHQFSGSSSCKEGSILLKLYSHFRSEGTWRPYFRLQQEIDERCEWGTGGWCTKCDIHPLKKQLKKCTQKQARVLVIVYYSKPHCVLKYWGFIIS